MKRLIYIFLVTAGLLSFVNCSDFLDADNKSNVTSEAYFNTESGFETLVNYAYAQMKSVYDGNGPAIFSSGTDLYHRGRNAMPDIGLHTYNGLNPENGTVSSFYTNCYKGIQAANCVLFYAETVDAKAETVTLRSAEAKFLRALYYFELAQQFGGVPLVKEYVNSIVTSVPRNTIEETYSYIIEELEALAAEGGPLPSTDLTGRVSKQAVYHYLSKVYLTAAWDLDNSGYFTKAASYSEKAIALGKGLDETFESLWLPANDNKHQEVIFAIQYDRTSSTGAGIAESDNGNSLQTNFCQYLGGADQGYKSTSSTMLPSERLMYLFQKGDSRYESTFMTRLYCTSEANPKTSGDYYAPYKGSTANNYIAFYYPPHYASSAADIAAWRAEDPIHRTKTIVIPMTSKTIHPDKSACTYYEACTTGDAVFGITVVRKFDDPESSYGGGTCYRDIVLARLAETYLIAAEAYLKAGNQGKADEMVNVVRERAFRGSGENFTKSNVTIDVILEERALEFVGERLRWTDLRRTRKLVDYNVAYNPELDSANDFIGADGKQKLYRPIPQNAIDLNSAEITQNPGY
jgi:hypothetical protein